MSIITTAKDKILKNSILARSFASGKDSRTKVVLARKIGKEGLPCVLLFFQSFVYHFYYLLIYHLFKAWPERRWV